MHTPPCMSNPPRPLSPTAVRVRDYAERGLTPREIAILTQLTTQRVYQLIAFLKDRGELSEKAAS
jgi:hypothetical protein